jgi:hypothetical protein
MQSKATRSTSHGTFRQLVYAAARPDGLNIQTLPWALALDYTVLAAARAGLAGARATHHFCGS